MGTALLDGRLPYYDMLVLGRHYFKLYSLLQAYTINVYLTYYMLPTTKQDFIYRLADLSDWTRLQNHYFHLPNTLVNRFDLVYCLPTRIHFSATYRKGTFLFRKRRPGRGSIIPLPFIFYWPGWPSKLSLNSLPNASWVQHLDLSLFTLLSSLPCLLPTISTKPTYLVYRGSAACPTTNSFSQESK